MSPSSQSVADISLHFWFSLPHNYCFACIHNATVGLIKTVNTGMGDFRIMALFQFFPVLRSFEL